MGDAYDDEKLERKDGSTPFVAEEGGHEDGRERDHDRDGRKESQRDDPQASQSPPPHRVELRRGGKWEDDHAHDVRELQHGSEREAEGERVEAEAARVRERSDDEIVEVEDDVVREAEEEERSPLEPRASLCFSARRGSR